MKKRADEYEGVIYDDWFEQTLVEMGADLSDHKVNPAEEKSEPRKTT